MAEWTSGPRYRRRIVLSAIALVVFARGAVLALVAFGGDDDDIAVGDDGGNAAPDETAVTAGGPDTAVSMSLPPLTSEAVLETYDLDPSAPVPWDPANWDVTVRSRDPETWDALDLPDAAHAASCGPPPATHPVTAHEDTVFVCKNHLMTSIRGDAYGLIYLTPDDLVDFSEGEAVISFDISTLRTSVRDWWDVWITPDEDALLLPLDLDATADLSGPPRRAIRVGLGTENQIQAEIYQDFDNVEFPDWPTGSITGDHSTGYETFLEPDARRRDTFEIRLSTTHIKVGMPAYDFWWIDTDIEELGWDSGVVQFGHHSYNPTKDCYIANNPRPPVDDCLPNTWHWDNFAIAPATQFRMIKDAGRAYDDDHDTASLAAPAPEDALLQFAGIGIDISIAVLSLIIFIWRFRRVADVDWSGLRTKVGPVIRRSVPYMTVALGIATYRQIDVIVISAVAGSRDLGWYSAADTLFGSLLFPTTVIVATVFPTMGRLYAHDRSGLENLVERSFSLLLIVMVPIGLGAGAVGPSFAPILFGDEFSGTSTLLMIFGPLTVLTFGATFLSSVAMASERQRFVALLLFGSAALTVPLDILLVPWATNRYDNGAIGGALAYVITEALQFGIMLAVIAPYLLTWAWAAKAARILAAGAVMTAAIWPIRTVFFVVPAAAGAVLYAVLAILFRLLDDDQKPTVGAAVRRLGISNRWAPSDDEGDG